MGTERPQPRLAEFVFQRFRRQTIVLWVILFGLFVATMIWTAEPRDRTLVSVSKVVGPSLFGIWTIVFLLHTRRWRRASRRAKSLGNKVCPFCQYDLSAIIRDGPLDDQVEVRCPECGLRKAISWVKLYWHL